MGHWSFQVAGLQASLRSLALEQEDLEMIVLSSSHEASGATMRMFLGGYEAAVVASASCSRVLHVAEEDNEAETGVGVERAGLDHASKGLCQTLA